MYIIKGMNIRICIVGIPHNFKMTPYPHVLSPSYIYTLYNIANFRSMELIFCCWL